jgi:hypothetical protein
MQFFKQLGSLVRMIATAGLLALTLLGLSTTAHAVTASQTFVSNSFPDFVGQAVSLSISVVGVAGTPTGIVTIDFGDGSATQQLALTNGAAATSHTFASAGFFNVTTTYGGDATYGTSQSIIAVQALQLIPTGSLTSSANPSTTGQLVTLTATLGGAGGPATGTVTIDFGDGTTAPVTLVNGVAAADHTYAGAGTYTVFALYPGDPTYSLHNMTLTQNVTAPLAASTTALTTSPNPSNINQSVTFTATVTGTAGTPTGTVTFSFGDGTTAPGTLAGGVASVTHSYTTAGSFTAGASYGGDGAFATSTAPAVTQNVGKSASTTALTTSPNPSNINQPVTFTATVTGTAGTPTGTVTFSFGDGTTAPGTLAAGVATVSHSYTAAGSFSAGASYGGDTNFATSSVAAITQNVGKTATTTALAASPNPANINQPVTFTATVTGTAGTPTGTVTFSFGDGTTAPGTLAGGVATVSHSYTAAGSFTAGASYGGDTSFATSSAAALTQNVGKTATTTTLSSSLNPSALGQSVSFTATVSGASPTGTVTFKDGATVLGTVALSGGIARFATAALTQGNHVITASYGGDIGFAASTSASLTEVVGTPADSVNLRSLQQRVGPMVGQISGQSIEGAIDSAIGEAFSGNGPPVSPSGSGIRFNFAADLEAQGAASAASPASDPFAGAFAGNRREGEPRPASSSRFNDAFGALGYAAPGKGAPARAGESPDWYGWAEVSGATLSRWGTLAPVSGSSALYGDQINVLAGVTRRLTPDFVAGVLGGYETFDYRSDAVQGRLKGDGWTLGSYLGWRFAQHVRFDAAVAYSGIGYDGTAGTAAGTFGGHRWLASGGLTGSYETYGLHIEPSARIYALWEREDAYTDSLGTLQGDRTFATGRASGGVKLSYPAAWDSGVKIAPYAGLFGDYYFNRDNAAATATLAAVPIPLVLDGWSARATAGIVASLASGAQLEVGGERSGIGGNFAIWTYRARASIPFGAR